MTVEGIFKKFGSAASLGRAIGRNGIRAAEMRKRGSIPARYWQALAAAAAAQGIEGVTLETLAAAHSKPRASGVNQAAPSTQVAA